MVILLRSEMAATGADGKRRWLVVAIAC